jgi:hypothetical protein
MLRTTGGLARYLEISHRFSAAEMRVSPWAAGGMGGESLGVLGLAALSVLFIGWVLVPLARGSELTRARLFLALWLGPAVLFFVAVPMGTPGHLMVLAPVPLLLAGLGLGRVSGSRGGTAGREGRARAGILLGVIVALNGGFIWTTVITSRREQYRNFREIQAACAPYAEADTAVLTTAGRTDVPHADLPFRAAMYLLPACRVFLTPGTGPGSGGGLPNEGWQGESQILSPPIPVRTRRALVDASLLRRLHGFPPPRLVVSNPEGELWLVQTPEGMVLGEGAIAPGIPHPLPPPRPTGRGLTGEGVAE